jgi:hypothetical protein
MITLEGSINYAEVHSPNWSTFYLCTANESYVFLSVVQPDDESLSFQNCIHYGSSCQSREGLNLNSQEVYSCRAKLSKGRYPIPG